MKKNGLMSVFILIFAASSLFAQHHKTDTWGIGIHGRNDFSWDKFESSGGPGISFKAPKIPLFWDLSLGLKNKWLTIGVSGDYYFQDKTFVEEINLGWFWGIGAYFWFTNSSTSEDTWSRFSGGIRIPIGISWIFREKLEVFGAWIPHFGVGFWNGSDSHSGIYFPDGSLAFEVGVRYWF
ncbi:hypothetical protein AGMMS49944_02900 [Spirochaetia bacterium]|nr:hypothetical protein AGMMS49944_02900 [Spirochaetia bacterium]